MKIYKHIDNTKQYLMNCDKSLEALSQYHCPIYAPDKKGNPTTIGSGVLINIYGHKFLVTAGHVFDYTYTHKVAIKSRNSLVNISGEIIDTKFAPTRAEDKIDIALLELNKEMEEALSDYKYLSIENIDYNHVSDQEHTMYTFVGFPATKNKLRYNSNRVKGGIFSYSATRVKEDIYNKLDISSTNHIAIQFKKTKLLSTDRKSSTAPDPYAMSGGGIWLNDNLYHHPSIYIPKTKLVGIALSWHKRYQCLMGISTGAVIEVIKANCNIPNLLRHETNMKIPI
jgi:hypothetical protein